MTDDSPESERVAEETSKMVSADEQRQAEQAEEERRDTRADWAKEFLVNIIHRQEPDNLGRFSTTEDRQHCVEADVDLAVRYADELQRRLDNL